MDGGSLTFPEAPRAKLDEALGDLVARASDVLATQGRLRALLRANSAISQQLELPVVLRKIVESAIDLVGAQYGALGVIGPDGSLEQFVHIGMGEDEADRIGHLPEGHGLLGALISDPRPIRLPHLGDDDRSSGFPEHHPDMDSFLGVPIRVGDRVFGDLYLTNAASGQFSSDDEELVTALASTAGFAIDNARLFESATRRQAWLTASAELTVAVAAGADDPLGLVVERLRAVARADLVCAFEPDADRELMTIARAAGHDHDTMVGLRVPRKGSVAGRVLSTGKPLLVAREQIATQRSTVGLGSTMVVPLTTAGQTRGALAVFRFAGGASFVPDDLELVADLAGRVGIALELASARSDRQHIALTEERGRIARDLHDHVIQQLFATGLDLQSIAGELGPGNATDRLQRAVGHLDESIAQIRTAIFALAPKAPGRQLSVRHRILDLIGELGDDLAQKPWLSFEGPVDLVIVDGLADDVLAVIREALTNIARHASATKVSVVVAIRRSRVEIDVSNDGAGTPSARRSGLANLRERATRRGGGATFETDSGTATLRWCVPIEGNRHA